MGAGETAFGPFVLDRSRMALLRDGKAVAIGQRGFALLSALIDGPETLTRAQLAEAVWPGAVVEEGNLNVQIAGLRKALGPRPDGQEWIITVPRVGYRLARDATTSPGQDGLSLPLLAVLPFQNLDGGDREARLAAGMVEDAVNALGLFRDFELLSPQSGRGGSGADISDPRLRYRLEGGVRRADDRLRITIQLVDAQTGAHIWTGRFDRPDGDILAIQDDVTYGVAGGAVAALQMAEIERGEAERLPSAYALYLRGVSKFKQLSPVGHAEGYDLIRRALEIDPRYPRVLSHGAMLISHNGRMGWPAFTSDDRATCAAFIERAEVGVSDDARVLGECAGALTWIGEYRRALALARRAAAINPFSMQAMRWFGVASIHVGDLDEANDAFLRAFRWSPEGLLAPVPLTGLAHVAMIRGDYEAALEWAEKSLAISARYDATYWMLIAANAHLGRMDVARAHLAELLRRVPNVTVAHIRAGQPDYDPNRMAAILEGLRIAGMPEA